MILKIHSIELLRENDIGAAEVALELAVMAGDQVVWSASSRDAVSAREGEKISGSQFTAFDEVVKSEGAIRIEGHDGQALRLRVPDGLHWYVMVVERDRKALRLAEIAEISDSAAPRSALRVLMHRITSRYGSAWQGWAVILGALLRNVAADDPLCAAVGLAGQESEMDFVVTGPKQGPSAQLHLSIEQEGPES